MCFIISELLSTACYHGSFGRPGFVAAHGRRGLLIVTGGSGYTENSWLSTLPQGVAWQLAMQLSCKPAIAGLHVHLLSDAAATHCQKLACMCGLHTCRTEWWQLQNLNITMVTEIQHKNIQISNHRL